MKIYKKIDNKLKKAPKKIIGMYNNLISGIVGGTIIYYLVILETIENMIAGSWYIIILIILGFIIINHVIKELRSEKSKNEERKNYFWNLLMALLGGFYLFAIFSLEINKIIATLILIIIFISISYWRIK
jgi:F0F1-type ATP synthase assembly protein I